MENTGAKCPACGGTNTHVYKRGYSLGLGLLGAVALTFAYMIWTIIRTDYSNLSEAGQTGVVIGMQFQLIWPVAAGLLCGLIGRNELRAKCRDCGKRFRP